MNIINKKLRTRAQQGFTLIELLVVVAIIGILSSVVMISVASAKNKAKNAIVMQSFKDFQKLLEQEYIDNGSYANLQEISATVFSNDPFYGPTCQTGFTSSVYVSDAQRLCQKIVDNVDYFRVGYTQKFGRVPFSWYSLSTTLKAPPVDFLSNPYEYCLGLDASYYGGPMGNSHQTKPGCFNAQP
jgi:prepilin-type N-terminal cleavage/methylation domain-containing protein